MFMRRRNLFPPPTEVEGLSARFLVSKELAGRYLISSLFARDVLLVVNATEEVLVFLVVGVVLVTTMAFFRIKPP